MLININGLGLNFFSIVLQLGQWQASIQFSGVHSLAYFWSFTALFAVAESVGSYRSKVCFIFRPTACNKAFYLLWADIRFLYYRRRHQQPIRCLVLTPISQFSYMIIAKGIMPIFTDNIGIYISACQHQVGKKVRPIIIVGIENGKPGYFWVKLIELFFMYFLIRLAGNLVVTANFGIIFAGVN